ncbi:N-methyl-L-tryptophan oxidase [Neobacillus niacini]|uniref:N-methyl-L-tryptophan oxidase n=1 Tax=Neobacillus niacini TaxID=86668 RepID=UPI0021CB4C51|nr:N-methyl-L-tryptophan oxidase [Neobacillus niacini]MCM3766271.1 N-methyl-L-tryptophan oxidase [Neobacillus niacini]
MKKQYDCVVVGAGTAGMAAGYFLAKQGVKTLLIDSFDPPHSNGSHHGDTRIIRHAYGEGEQYVPMVLRAQQLWEELQQEAEETLFLKTGILGIGPEDSPFIQEVVKSAKTYNLPLEWMDSNGVKQRWPGFEVPEGYIGCFESSSGVLLSEKCIGAFRKLALSENAELWTNTRVNTIGFQPNGVIVETANDRVYADKCIVTAGAWTGKLLNSLNIPLTPVRKTVAWFEADEGKYNQYQFPGFYYVVPNQMFYGFPSIDGSGVKVGRMDGGQNIDPDQVDRSFGIYKEDEGELRSFVQAYMPDAAGKLKAGKVCLFTRTPDEDFIIDFHPDYPHVAIAGGFSGHGFKFGSVFGEILANMTLGKKVKFDLSHFRIGRFSEAEPNLGRELKKY